MLKISNLTKTYAKNTFKAVDDISFEVGQGEIFGFIGPNGAGKTTTIKCMCGIMPFDAGKIEIAGIDLVTDPLTAKRNIGYVSDSHVIYDKLSGREYVNFLADVYEVDAETRNKRVDKLLDLFKMRDSYGEQINTYSHGMKQKISIIGALIHAPKLWVLDEPMTGLDPASAYELKQLMREHCKAGNTVFFSTHILEVAEKLCDRIAIISGGKIVLLGDMDEIKSRQNDESLEEIFLSVTGEKREGA
ncbi:MAG: ABC transporter ATP-binding protein [Clostridiales bacterium]|nr:ABC transporter ATP-binding protein [Clostridiales bacterium]